MSIKPLADRVVAKKEAAQTTTASGLLLVDSAKESANIAVIESVGPEVKDLKAGDRIIYSQYAGTEVKVQGKDYLIIKAEDILAII